MVAGYLSVAAGVLTLADYAVIGGWVGRYLVGYLTGATMTVSPTAVGAFFEHLIAGTFAPLAWALGFVAITTLIVLSGVRHGIERANAVLLPLLALLLVAMAAYALMLPGAGEGLRFLLTPDWSAFGQGEAYLAAVRRPGVRPPRRAGRGRSSTGPGWGGPGCSRCVGSRRR